MQRSEPVLHAGASVQNFFSERLPFLAHTLGMAHTPTTL
jgi:hypothetical protein